ncbi:hypothetical protein [Streptomyces sp. NPDC058371]|uniref:hypothetical protein n=1 Tax=Streptomyces sp. NPDC058371 TaxID=3346463 RepID=UPI003656F525
MRALSARRLASSALCATLLAGIAAPAAMAADSDSARGRTASAAPVPGADGLLVQVTALAGVGSVLTPVTDLLSAVLKADNGRLSADEVTKLGDAAKAAIVKASAAAPVTPPAAQPPAKPATPTTPTAPTLPGLPALGAQGPQGKAVLDIKADAVTDLQATLENLLKAVTSGDVSKVVPAVTGVLTGLVNVVVSTVVGSGLPAPSLPGLPALPSTSGVPTTGQLPS